jgi:hypothetical protein
MRTIIQTAITSIIVATLAVAATTIAAQDDITIRGGVVRLGASPELHNDAKHRPVGIKSISLLDNCDLRVILVNDGDNRIVTITVDEDAQLASMGIIAGAYGGASSFTVEMWKHGERVCANDAIFDGANVDLWLSAVVSDT